jgi:hypothetical protein
VHEELQCMHDESQCNAYPKTNSENQVSEFLCCCLKVLGDPLITKKLTHLLMRWIEEGENEDSISAPLPEWDVHHVSKRKQMVENSK